MDANLTTNSPVVLYLDPPSRKFEGDRLFDAEAAAYGGDALLAPYVHLREALTARGVAVHTADRIPEAADDRTKLYVALSRLDRYRALARRPDIVLSAYVGMECPIVEPSLYTGLRHARHAFRRLYTWGDPASLAAFIGEKVPMRPFSWPQSFDSIHEALWDRTDRQFLVMINSNKLPRLGVRELYRERMRAVAHFAAHGEIDLYGNGWDGPSIRVGWRWLPRPVGQMKDRWHRLQHRLRPDPLLVAAQPAYRGRAESKSETLSRYRFALCFENMVEPGWITEKIFDCFYCGTVPVYWGAPDIAERIPPQTFIDMRDFAGYDDLRAYLHGLTEAEVEAYREAARAFLGSPAFAPFRREALTQLFLDLVAEDASLPRLAPAAAG